MNGGSKAISKIWDRHWRLAESTESADRLLYLLDDHLRRFHGEPNGDGLILPADTGEDRCEVINYIIGRLEDEFGITELQPLLHYELPEQEPETAMGMGML